MAKSKELTEQHEQELALQEKQPTVATAPQKSKSTKNTQTIDFENNFIQTPDALPVSNKPVASKQSVEANIRKRTISDEILKTSNEEKPVSKSTNTKKIEPKQISSQVSTKSQPKQREKIQLVNTSVKKPLVKKSVLNEKKSFKRRFFGTVIVLSVVIFVSISFMLFVWAANQEHLNFNDLLSLVNRHFSINV